MVQHSRSRNHALLIQPRRSSSNMTAHAAPAPRAPPSPPPPRRGGYRPLLPLLLLLDASSLAIVRVAASSAQLSSKTTTPCRNHCSNSRSFSLADPRGRGRDDTCMATSTGCFVAGSTWLISGGRRLKQDRHRRERRRHVHAMDVDGPGGRRAGKRPASPGGGAVGEPAVAAGSVHVPLDLQVKNSKQLTATTIHININSSVHIARFVLQYVLSCLPLLDPCIVSRDLCNWLQ